MERPGKGYLSPKYAPWVVEPGEGGAPPVGALASRGELSQLERGLKALLDDAEG